MPRREVPDSVAAKVGARIRGLRETMGITQEKLAYEAGLSKGHVSGIEKGLVRPTLTTLSLLAERLEVDLLDLFTFPAESPRQKVVDATRGLSASALRKLLQKLNAPS